MEPKKHGNGLRKKKKEGKRNWGRGQTFIPPTWIWRTGLDVTWPWTTEGVWDWCEYWWYCSIANWDIARVCWNSAAGFVLCLSVAPGFVAYSGCRPQQESG